MKTNIGFAVQAALFLAVTAQVSAIPAFPGAEGWGANSTGGRGGAVIHVTNLNDNGPGSFRSALASETPKIIVFDTGGVFNLSQPLTIHGNTYVAGQTAPGGVTLTNGGILIHYGGGDRNIILRFVRVRGVGLRDSDGDAIRMAGGTDLIVDHCSGSWACDETFDFYATYNSTCQWSVLAEMYSGCVSGSNLGRYGYLGGDDKEGRQSLHHCLFAHFYGRTPLMSTYGGTITVPAAKAFDVRNNLFYDCAGGGGYFHNDNRIPVNLVGNYYKGGNSGGYSTSSPAPNDGTPGTPVYTKANVLHTIPAMSPDNMQRWFWVAGSVTLWATDSFAVPPVSTTPGRQAYIDVLSGAGVFPRDSADRRFVSETMLGTGDWANVGDPQDPLGASLRARPVDTDNDGMPDAWESARGLNPADANDYLTKMNNGYDAIEVYVNELADSLSSCAPFRDSSWMEEIAVEKATVSLPEGAARLSAAPNPFSVATDVRISLSGLGLVDGTWHLGVYDVAGRLMKRLAPAYEPGGRTMTARWDGNGPNGRKVKAGVYVCRLTGPGLSAMKKITIIR